MSILAAIKSILFPPRNMPAPDPQCRTYTTAETVVLFRNHEQQVRRSSEYPSRKENQHG